MTVDPLPEALRKAVEADPRPVRPLSPLWRRTLAVVLVAVALLAAVAATHTLRPDLRGLSPWLGWGATLVEILVGVALIGLALRDSVPGQAVSRPAVALAVAAGLAVNFLTAFATWAGTRGVTMPDMAACGATCMRTETWIALPAVLVTLVLVLRALPLRPAVVGLLGGAGAGLMADGINHLLCPMSDLRHILVWHTGAILCLMAAGWLAGTTWEFLRSRRT